MTVETQARDVAQMAADPAKRPKFTWPYMVLYGMGYISNQVKSGGLSAFMMIYYNQVLGLPASLVGLGAALALVVDAFVDPAVGQISDNTKSRWGRRHPYMYAAAAPVAILFFLLWNPPASFHGMTLFAYMMTCLISIRVFDTFFELPSSALLPELVEDYDKRTVAVSIRVLAGMFGGLGMTIFAYQIAMKETATGGGVLSREGYLPYSIVGALVIFTAILVSSIATHKFIPWLDQTSTGKAPSPLEQLRQVGMVLKNKAFATIMISGSLIYLVAGVSQGLSLYITLFFWGFSQAQLSVYAAMTAAAVLIGGILAPPLSRRIGKKKAALLGYVVGAAGELTPYFARLLGLLPENGDPTLFYYVAAGKFLNFVCWGVTGICVSAMIADVVESNAVRTGRRAEGFVFAADSLFKKIASAGGPALSGLFLAAVMFPIGAKKGEVAPEILTNLVLLYIPFLIAVYIASMSFMAFYNIDRESHHANVRTLKEDV